MIVPIISTLLLVGQFVSGMPFHQAVRNLPHDVAHIAHDKRNGLYLAYKRGGSLYGTYSDHIAGGEYKRDDGASCTKLSIEEAKQLPGYKKIEEYANTEFGKGSRKATTNPTNSDQLGKAATACVGDAVVDVEMDGTPTCIEDKSDGSGKVAGTNGTLRLTYQTGFTNEAQWTVTTGSTIGVSSKISATFKIPELLEVGAELTTSVELKNEVAQGFKTSVSNLVSKEFSINTPDGKSCNAEFTTQSCNTQGHGKIRYLAKGWIWFEYDDETNGHYKWAASMDEILTEDERSSFLEFTGSMKGESHSQHNAECLPTTT